MQKVWQRIGTIAYWVLLPLIRVYAKNTKPRARVLILHEDKVLVVKNWLGSGGWALPGGGLEPGELPVQAAAREIAEELGITVPQNSLIELGTHESTEDGKLVSKYHLFVLTLDAKPILTLRKREIMDSAWLGIPELQQREKGVGATVKDAVEVWSSRSNLV